MARQTVLIRAEGGTTRDAMFLAPDKFTLNPDNPRTDGPELTDWIEWLAGQMMTVGYLPGNALIVRRDEARTVESGNCRLRAGELAYVHSIRCEFGRPRPICRKIKKDGTPSQKGEGMYGPAWRNITLHHRLSVDQASK